jgi:hypothetical protein
LSSQRFEPRAAAQRRAGLVEGDVAVAADAENLEVDAAGVLDPLLVLPAMDLEIERPAIGHVGAFGVDIDVVEQVLLHEGPVALRMSGAQADVFVQIEGRYLREVEPFFLVQPDQLAVGAQRAAACRQPQHALRPLTDEVRYEPGRPAAGGIGIGLDDDAHGRVQRSGFRVSPTTNDL